MPELTIGHLAERSGVATSTIRFYESRGLVHSRRTTGNQRRYEQSDLRRCALHNPGDEAAEHGTGAVRLEP